MVNQRSPKMSSVDFAAASAVVSGSASSIPAEHGAESSCAAANAGIAPSESLRGSGRLVDDLRLIH